MRSMGGLQRCEKPLVLVTTSHRPSQRVRSFVKDLVAVLPCAVKFTRGKATVRDLYYEAAGLRVKRVVVVSTWKGNPGTIWVYEPVEPGEAGSEGGGLRLVARIRLRGVRLSRERPGARRRSGPAAVLGVYPEDNSEEGRLLADTLVRGFLARLLVDPSTPGVDVVAVVRGGSQGYVAEVDFRCPRGGACGPVMRVAGFEDLVSGVRVHRAGGVGGEAGAGAEGGVGVRGAQPSGPG